MDDDLMSLRGAGTEDDDDLFAPLSDREPLAGEDPFASLDATELGAETLPGLDVFKELGAETLPGLDLLTETPGVPEPPPVTTPGPLLESEERPEWLRELIEREEEGGETRPAMQTAALAEPPRPEARPARARSRSTILGMTPRQLLAVSVFLFLDVAVLGVLLLIAIGAINIPLP
jgi:hypothetical protein